MSNMRRRVLKLLGSHVPTVTAMMGVLFSLPVASHAVEPASSSKVLGSLQAADLTEPMSDAGRHRVAGLIYDRFVEVMSLSGYEVQIATSEFATIRREQFSTYRAGDAQSYDSPRRLNVTPITSSLNGEVQGVTYKPEWELTPENPTAEESASITLLDSFAESASILENFEAPVAITTFRVHLAFAGESLTYRAMVSWLTPDKRSMARFRADDVNIQFLNEAFSETRRIAPRTLFKAQTMGHLIPSEIGMETSFNNPPSNLAGSLCTPDFNSYSYPAWDSRDSLEHSSASGYHRGYAASAADCSCDTACTSVCDAEFSASSCTDRGNDLPAIRRHQPYSSVNIQDGMVPNALNSAASCAAGLGCVIQSCPRLGSCEGGSFQVSIGTGVLGVTLQFGFSGSKISDLQQSFTFGCSKCTTFQPEGLSGGSGGRGPFNQRYDDEGTPGGTGGNIGGFCKMICSPRWVTSGCPNGIPSPCLVEYCDIRCI